MIQFTQVLSLDQYSRAWRAGGSIVLGHVTVEDPPTPSLRD